MLSSVSAVQVLSECCCYPVKLARFDSPSYTGCWLCVDAELAMGCVGLGVRSLWSDQPLAPPAEDVAGIEIPVDLPM